MNDNIGCDIALIHPPHIFNTERYDIFPLPWNLNHVGSTSFIGRYPIGPSWTQMPLGFYTMKNYIENNSDKTVNIINLALLRDRLPKNIFEKFKHLQDKSILADLAEVMSRKQIVSIIKNLKADLFAVDLHWLNYSQGAIQILKLLKQFYPDCYTVVGGLTASYYRDEIMNSFPFIDFLIIGDGSIPLLELIKQIKGNRDFYKIPNLLYRESGKIKKGPRRFLNDFKYAQDDDKLFESIPTSRGCPLQCITCGGSKYASRKLSTYTKVHVYSVESIMKKLFTSVKESKGEPVIFLIHDPFLTLGNKNREFLLNEIKKNKLNVRFLIEFFLPHSKEEIFNIAEKVPDSSIRFSPESMDVEARTFHKNLRYSNKELIMNIDVINNIKELSMVIWFMVGLAKDTKQGVDKTLFFIKNYYKKLKDIKKNSFCYNELLFIDPGSLAFDFVDRNGYTLINKSFLSHLESFKMPIFKYQINYRTRYYTRDQLFDLFLYMHNKMNKIYYENNIIDKQNYERVTKYNNLLKQYSSRYDNALLEKNINIRNAIFEKIGNLFRSEMSSFI